MIKDIPQLKVDDVAVAIVPPNSPEDELWDTYLINLKEEPLRNVIIASTGYGELGGQEVKTTTLRYFYEEIEPLGMILVEPIQAKLFEISNEYWISFVLDDHMYDKKFVFVRGSIDTAHFTTIPFLGRKGVMIR